MEKIETRTAFISLHKKNIVWTHFKQEMEIDESDIRENIAASLILTKGARHSAVLDTRGKQTRITNKAMKFGSSNEVTKHRIATAHLTNSRSGLLFGNFFMRFYKPKINNRMFSDDLDAVKWLESFLN